MTPDQAKAWIAQEHMRLLSRGIPEGAVERLIVAQAREAAAHNGVPELWRNYLPFPQKAYTPEDSDE